MEKTRKTPIRQIVMVVEPQLIGSHWYEGWNISNGSHCGTNIYGYSEFIDVGCPERASKLNEKGVALVVSRARAWKREFDELDEDEKQSDMGLILADFLNAVRGEPNPMMTNSLEFVDAPYSNEKVMPDPTELEQLRTQVWGGVPVKVAVNDIKLTVVVNGQSEQMTVPIEEAKPKPKKKRKAAE